MDGAHSLWPDPKEGILGFRVQGFGPYGLGFQALNVAFMQLFYKACSCCERVFTILNPLSKV